MRPVKSAQAGSFESSDIIILIEPLAEGSGRKIELSSTVMKQFGDTFTQIVNDTLDEHKLTDIHLIAKDKGALEPTIKARLITAINRSLDTAKGTLNT
jgi:citrate lyase subunit gamma (acyl carrier protein)